MLGGFLDVDGLKHVLLFTSRAGVRSFLLCLFMRKVKRFLKIEAAVALLPTASTQTLRFQLRLGLTKAFEKNRETSHHLGAQTLAA